MGMVRILSCVAVLVSSVALSAALPAAASTSTNYVALGDSYSSGVGTGDYFPASGSCDRSPHAYPELWKSAHDPNSFTFDACSGAKTTDVATSQVSALSAATTLVTVTVGGNDAGFSRVMTTCVLTAIAGPGRCEQVVDDAVTYIHDTLPARLAAAYSAIREHAPNARVVVLGYPRLYTLDGSCHIGIGDVARGYLNNAADQLDDQIAKNAANAGFEFVDVRAAFANHGICSSDWWLNSTTWPIEESYHPNVAGQEDGYLPALESVTAGEHASQV